jgi:Ca2+-transporting ATPase
MHKNLTPPAEITWHAASDQDVMTQLGTGPDGLTDREITERLQRFGANTLARSGGTSPWLIFWLQINNPIGWLLLAASALAVALKKPTDAAVVFGAVVINAIIGFIQEYRAGKAIEALATMIPEVATAIRNGQSIAVSADGLVPGDEVTVQSGDKVPAVIRLIRV